MRASWLVRACDDALVQAESRDELPTDGARAGFVAPGDDTALRLQQLAHSTAHLAAAESIESIVEVAVSHVAEAIRAAVATLMLLEDSRLVMVGAHGVRPGIEQRFASFGLADENPASDAVRRGIPLVLSATDDIEARYPALAGTMPAGRSLVCLPLLAGSRALGVIGLTFDDNWTPGPRELDFLTTFADSCAQAIRRVRATEEALDKARQLAFLAGASAELASSLDYRQTLSNVARLSVPVLADWCAVAILHRDALTTLAVAHADPAKAAWAWELQDRYPPDPDASTGPPNVLRTGVSELYPEITDDMLAAGAHDEEHLQLSRELDLHSALVVPLSARGRTLGVITLVRAGSSRSYGPADLAVAEDLGRRAGIAIDNALLHGQTQDVALQLQRAVLPADLSGLDGWQVATHYNPSGQAQVGGDFYDAIPLGDDNVAVFIGDVMGHGVEAAAAMAQMRASVRAFLTIDPAPQTVVSKLDQMFVGLAIGQLATLVYAVVDRGAGELRMVNAGHYPPLIVDAAGAARFAQAPVQRPLGVGGDERTHSVWPLEPEDTVLFYTDGLVERRGEIIDDGLRRLSLAADGLAGNPLQATLDDLVARLGDEAGDDDVTAIAIRAVPRGPETDHPPPPYAKVSG